MNAMDFCRCSYREFVLRHNGYQDRRSREMEHTRAICYYIACTVWDKKEHGPIPSIESFWPLPTDPEPVKQQSDYEFLKAVIREAQKNTLPN